MLVDVEDPEVLAELLELENTVEFDLMEKLSPEV